ncbi:uncharacterized protein ACNLHF_028214 [Anomaloglossus baeobatrachus]
MEPLAESIRLNPEISGVKIGPVEHKIGLYADDTMKVAFSYWSDLVSTRQVIKFESISIRVMELHVDGLTLGNWVRNGIRVMKDILLLQELKPFSVLMDEFGLHRNNFYQYLQIRYDIRIVTWLRFSSWENPHLAIQTFTEDPLKGNEDVDSDTTNVNEPPQILMHQEPSTSGSNMACAARDNQYLGTTSTKQPKKKLCVQQSVEKFILKTTTSQKEHFDELIAKFIFATNSSFRLVEHPLFVQMIEGIRPGYKPPSRFDISGKHLQAVYDIERAACTKYLKDEVVNMSLDGWSNIHNDPIICTCVTTEDGETYLTDTIDTSGNSHTAEYLLEIAKNSIHQCQEQFGCKVRSLVTDNASNVAKMRAELAQDDTNVITYGCSAHLLHLLSKDLHILGVKEHVEIVKYFRNNHFAHATYKEMGGLKLVLPQDVRWNTLADCLELFINNWSKLLSICETHRDKIDANIRSKVLNLGVKRNAEDLLERLKPISIALDKMQKDTATIADATEVWKDLEGSLDLLNLSNNVKVAIQHRKDQALKEEHYLANFLHPIYRGKKLSEAEINSAMEWLANTNHDIVATVLKLKCESAPFQKHMFADNVVNELKPLDWWKSQSLVLPAKIINLATQLLTASASSAGVERLFSSFGFVHTTVRNRLGTAKAGQLVFLLKVLNKQ